MRVELRAKDVKPQNVVFLNGQRAVVYEVYKFPESQQVTFNASSTDPLSGGRTYLGPFHYNHILTVGPRGAE